MAKQKKIEDTSSEEKIKQAARKLFTEKGFDAVKTRDIAAEAGINLALLNYYFRNKQNLFDIIMVENFEQFIQQLLPVFGDESLTLDERLEQITTRYIDMLKSNPGLPSFIMNQMHTGSNKLMALRPKLMSVRNNFIAQIEGNIKKKGIKPLHTAHLMMNFMGLMIFPFIAQPMLMRINELSKTEFDILMDERKKLIPIWLKAIITGK